MALGWSASGKAALRNTASWAVRMHMSSRLSTAVRGHPQGRRTNDQSIRGPQPGEFSKLTEPDDSDCRNSCCGDQLDDGTSPRHGCIPCIHFVQRDKANDAKTHGEGGKADGKPVALDEVPHPDQAVKKQGGHDQCDAKRCHDLKNAAILIHAILPREHTQPLTQSP